MQQHRFAIGTFTRIAGPVREFVVIDDQYGEHDIDGVLQSYVGLLSRGLGLDRIVGLSFMERSCPSYRWGMYGVCIIVFQGCMVLVYRTG
jgi:hypothetical protein